MIELAAGLGSAVATAVSRLRGELAGYGIEAGPHEDEGTGPLSVWRDLVVWCEQGPEGLCYRWWTGRLSQRTGRRVFTLCRVDASAMAARRIAERYREVGDHDPLPEVAQAPASAREVGQVSGGLTLSIQDVAVRHGYTVADLHKLAKSAMYRSRWRFLDFSEKYDLAWSAIAEHLCTREDVPTRDELIRYGERAISEHVVGNAAYRGVYVDHRERGQNGHMSRYYAFWQTQASPAPSPEGRVVDRMAFRQIWPRMTKRNKEVIRALAEHGDYEAAADALGVSRRSFPTMISLARQQFFRLWHEGETPSRFWGRDTRAGPDHYGGRGYKRAQRALKRRMNRRARAREAMSEVSRDRRRE